MRKIYVVFVLLLCVIAKSSIGQTSGIFESYAIISINGGANAYYDLQPTTGNPDFEGANLGTFIKGTNTLVFRGGQNKTYKNGGCNILNSSIWYRVFLTGSPSGAFTGVTEPFAFNIGGAGDQQWEQAGNTTELISALPLGNYTLQVYTQADFDGCGNGTHFITNGGANYNATFSVVCNPATLPSASIAAAPAGAICTGTNVTFTATPTNGGAAPSYQWYIGATLVGTNSATFASNTLVNGDAVSVVMTSNDPLVCAGSLTLTSNIITETVNPLLPASVNIAVVPAGAICTGTNVTFTATPTNGGAAPIYQWKLNGANVGAGLATYNNAALVNSDVVTVEMISNATPCLTGSPAAATGITMTVNPNHTISLTSGSSTPSLCINTALGTNIVYTIGAGATGAGVTGLPVGMVGNISGTTFTISGTPTASGSFPYTVTTIGNACVAATATGTITVNANHTISLTSGSNTPTLCINTLLGTNIVYTIGAGATGAGVTGLPAGMIGTLSGTTYTISGTPTASGSFSYTVTTTGNACVAATATGTITVSPALAASVSIAAAPATPICFGTSVTFTATPINGGTPTYQWKLNGANVGTGLASYSNTALANGDVVTVVMTTSLCAVPVASTSNSVTMSVTTVSGALSGTYTIPSVCFPTVASAAIYLNANGVSGAVTFNVTAGHTETAPAGGITLLGAGTAGNLATGTATNTITFIKNGAGANPTITANGSLIAGTLTDGIIKIIGGDYLTLNGLNLIENSNSAFTPASNTMTEYGIALLNASATDGPKNITITNCTIDLNNLYSNSFGIYSNSTHTSSTISTTLATAVGGEQNDITITKNTITDVNIPISIVGATSAANVQNNRIVIGGSAGNGNTISSFGRTQPVSGFNAVSGTINGVIIRNCKEYSVSNNTFTSLATATISTVRAIFVDSYNNAPTAGNNNININNNSISLSANGAAITAIEVSSLSGTATSVNINNNDFSSFSMPSASLKFIQTQQPATASNINGNTFTNLNVATTGNVTFITNITSAQNGESKTVNTNKIITGFNKTGAGGVVTLYVDAGASVTGSTVTNDGNEFSNITLTAASTTINGWQNTDNFGTTSMPTKTITNNKFENWSTTAGAACAVMDLNGFGGTLSSVSNNTITNITKSSTFALTGINLQARGNATTLNVNNNVMNGLTTATGTLYGITDVNTSSTTNITQNQIKSLNSAATTVYAINHQTATNILNISNNTVNNLTSTSTNTGAALRGVSNSAAATVTIDNNIINNLSLNYNLSGNIITGISCSNAATGTTPSIKSNTLHTFTGTSTVNTSQVIGISAGGSQNNDISNNTLYNFTGNSSTTSTTAPAVVGIISGSSGTAQKINNNIIYGLKMDNATNNSNTVAAISTTSSSGGQIYTNTIYGFESKATGTNPFIAGYIPNGGSWTFANNMISLSNGSLTNGMQCVGVFDNGGTGVRKYYYNSLRIAGSSIGNQVSVAFQFNAATGTADIKNNIFDNVRIGGGKNYAVANLGANFTGLTFNNNLFNSPNTSTIGVISGPTDRTFAQWQTSSGGDASSIANFPVVYTDATTANLHVTPDLNCALNGAATPIAAITTDYDNDTRNATTPDIGADEFTSVLPTLTITNPAAVCSPVTVDLTAPTVTIGSTTGGSFTYWTDAAATVTLASPNAIAISNTYYIQLNKGTCKSTVQPVIVTINPVLPASVTIAALPVSPICAGTNVTFTATPTNGGAAPVYQWKLNGGNVGTNSTTYANNALVNGDIVTVEMTSNATPCLTGSPATSAGINMVVNPNLPASVTVAALPAGAICAGTSVTFTATPTNGGATPVYQWYVGATQVGTNSDTYTSTTLANGDVVTVEMTSNPTPCLTGSPATSTGITMVINTRYTWTGATNTNWNTATNWLCGNTPTASDNVTIPAGAPNYPSIGNGQSGTCFDIDLAAGATMSVSGTGVFSLNGNITNTGGILDLTDGTLRLAEVAPCNGLCPYTFLSGLTIKDKAVKNIIVATIAGLNFIANDNVKVTGKLSFEGSNRIFNTQDNLTLVSNATATASIADITNNGVNSGNIVNGKVSIERYLRAIKSWRYLATPVDNATSPTITDSWREGGTSFSSNGWGTRITGPSNVGLGTPLGFDQVTQRGSMKSYSSTTNTFVEITSTNLAAGKKIANDEGYAVFVNGDRGEDALHPTSVSTTTLRIKGNIRTGDQTFNISAAAVAVGGFQSVGNPYPSQIDFRSIDKTNVASTFYIWNPNGGYYGVGQYENYTKDLNFPFHYRLNGLPAGAILNTIESGQAFFIQSTTVGSITIKETDKTTGSDLVSRVGVTVPTLEISLHTANANGNDFIADGVVLNFGNNFSSALDNNDVKKITNSVDNLAIKYGTKNLVAERRPNLTQIDTIRLGLTSTRVASYRFEIDPSVLSNTGLAAFLKDKFLQTETPVSLTAVTNINFAITADAGSKVADRFMIVFRQAAGGPLPVRFIDIAAAKNADKTNTVKWNVGDELNIQQYEIERSEKGRNFLSIGNAAALNNTGGSYAYNFVDATPLAQDNYYKVKAISVNGETQYSAIVKVLADTKETSISVYPNPVEGKLVKIHFTSNTGKYSATLLNAGGKTVYTKNIVVVSNNETHTIEINKYFAAGNYSLVLLSEDGTKKILPIVIL